MKDKVFIDTNLLIYSIDPRNKAKQKKARQLLKDIIVGDVGVISTQVIEEFFVVATKKLGISHELVKEIITGFERFEVVQITVEMIKHAIDVSVLYKLSFWDSLIIVSAESSKCTSLLTEDLNSSQVIKGVTVVNPFV